MHLLDLCIIVSHEQLEPPQGMRAVSVLGRIHLDPVTDLAWSPCGTYLAVSSRDGYCTLAAFTEGDLGERVPADTLPPHLAARMAAAAGKLPPRCDHRRRKASVNMRTIMLVSPPANRFKHTEVVQAK